jgi:hypothetical protein
MVYEEVRIVKQLGAELSSTVKKPVEIQGEDGAA